MEAGRQPMAVHRPTRPGGALVACQVHRRQLPPQVGRRGGAGSDGDDGDDGDGIVDPGGGGVHRAGRRSPRRGRDDGPRTGGPNRGDSARDGRMSRSRLRRLDTRPPPAAVTGGAGSAAGNRPETTAGNPRAARNGRPAYLGTEERHRPATDGDSSRTAISRGGSRCGSFPATPGGDGRRGGQPIRWPPPCSPSPCRMRS